MQRKRTEIYQRGGPHETSRKMSGSIGATTKLKKKQERSKLRHERGEKEEIRRNSEAEMTLPGRETLMENSKIGIGSEHKGFCIKRGSEGPSSMKKKLQSHGPSIA